MQAMRIDLEKAMAFLVVLVSATTRTPQKIGMISSEAELKALPGGLVPFLDKAFNKIILSTNFLKPICWMRPIN